MKVNQYRPKVEPKSRASALRLAAQVTLLMESTERRRNNLMKLETEHKSKIAKLQAKLEQIQKELQTVKPEEALEYIEQLKLQHSLTDAEILELRSELLRRSIENQQLQYNMLQKTGEKHSEANSPQ